MKLLRNAICYAALIAVLAASSLAYVWAAERMVRAAQVTGQENGR